MGQELTNGLKGVGQVFSFMLKQKNPPPAPHVNNDRSLKEGPGIKTQQQVLFLCLSPKFQLLHFILLLARKPEKVDHIDAAGCIGDVIKAYTALHYQARVCGGETILIFDGASVSM